MRNSLLAIGLFLTLLLLQQCAQVQAPSGGPKDTEPPEVVRALPSNGTVEFQGQGFVLQFDEFVRTRQLQQELIISPPLEEDPEITLKGKELRVQWEGELEEDQTYSFRFGSSIEDITEGNSVEGLVYAFSTGPHLDSLHYEGRVVDARSMKGVEGALAMLYREKADSVPRTKRPFYFARTDAQGHFDIPYLAEGNYKFFALDDQNRNQRFDLPNEGIAFRKEPVRPYPADSAGDELFRLFVEKGEEQFIDSREISSGKAFFKLKLPAEEVTLETLDGEGFPWDHVKAHRKGSDSLTYWFPDPDMPDSLELAFLADSIVLDTVLVQNRRKLLKTDSVLELEKGFEDPLEWSEQAAFVIEHPLSELDPSRITAVSDSDTVDLGMRIGGFASRSLILEDREAFGEKISLTLLPGAVKDTFGRLNDTLEFAFSVREKDAYGSLRVMTELEGDKEGQIILSLLDAQGQAVRKRVDSSGRWIEFPYLNPGDHRLELIRDEIPNGHWDPGKYPDRQPEPVLYYPDTINVRSNWEQEVEWREIGE